MSSPKSAYLTNAWINAFGSKDSENPMEKMTKEVKNKYTSLKNTLSKFPMVAEGTEYNSLVRIFKMESYNNNEEILSFFDCIYNLEPEKQEEVLRLTMPTILQAFSIFDYKFGNELYEGDDLLYTEKVNRIPELISLFKTYFLLESNESVYLQGFAAIINDVIMIVDKFSSKVAEKNLLAKIFETVDVIKLLLCKDNSLECTELLSQVLVVMINWGIKYPSLVAKAQLSSICQETISDFFYTDLAAKKSPYTKNVLKLFENDPKSISNILIFFMENSISGEENNAIIAQEFVAFLNESIDLEGIEEPVCEKTFIGIIDYAKSYNKRFECNSNANSLITIITEFLIQKDNFIKYTFEEVFKNQENKYINFITLILRSLNPELIKQLAKNNLISYILTNVTDEKVLNNTIFSDIDSMSLYYLCEVGMLLNNEIVSNKYTFNIVLECINLIKKKNYSKLKIAAYLCSAISKKSCETSIQIALLISIIDIFVLVQDEEDKEPINSIFNSILEIIKSIGEKISEKGKDAPKILEYLINSINKISDKNNRHDLMMSTINFYNNAIIVIPELSNRATLEKIFKNITVVKIKKRDIKSMMKVIMDEKGELIKNSGLLYFLFKWMEGTHRLQKFCTKYSKLLDNEANIIQLFNADANEVILREIGRKGNEKISDLYLSWITKIGVYSFYKNDIRTLIEVVSQCSLTNAITLIETFKKIIALSETPGDGFEGTEKIRRRAITSIKAMGGPCIFLPLYWVRKDINGQYITLLTSIFTILLQNNSGFFNNMDYFSILNATFKKVQSKYFDKSESDEMCFEKAFVTELINIYNAISNKQKYEMLEGIISDFSLTKHFDKFVPDFFTENKNCLESISMEEMFMQLFVGYQDNEPINDEVVNILYDFLKEQGHVNQYPNLIMYCAYNSLDTTIGRLCLKLAIDISKENPNAFNDILNESNLKPFMCLLKSKNIGNMKLVIQLLTVIKETGEIVLKCLVPDAVMKLLAFMPELSDDALKDESLIDFLLEGEYSVKKNIEYLPLICHLIDSISKEKLDDLCQFLINDVDDINNNIYYICIIYIMYKTKEYQKWCKALQPIKISIDNIEKTIRALNMFGSLPGIETEDYLDTYTYYITYVLEKDWLNFGNIGIFLYSSICIARSPYLSYSKIDNFSSLMHLIEKSFTACNEFSIPGHSFTPYSKKVIIDLIQKISKSQYQAIIKNQNSMHIYIEVLLKMIEADEEPYTFSKLEIRRIYRFTRDTLNDREGTIESMSYIEPILSSICAHLYSGLVETRFKKEAGIIISLFVEDKDDIDQNDTVWNSLDLFFTNIRNCPKEIKDDFHNILEDYKDIGEGCEVSSRNLYNEVLEKSKFRDETAIFNLRKLKKNLFNAVEGFGKNVEKVLVQDKSTDFYGRRLRVKVKKNTTKPTKQQTDSKKEKIEAIKNVSQNAFGTRLLTFKGENEGVVFISKASILFESVEKAKSIKVIEKKTIRKLIFVSGSNFCELYTNDFKSFLFSFANCTKCNQFVKKLEINPVIIEGQEKIDGLFSNWRNRKITNYQFLYWINIYSGKSYNNLNNYPIFPWVLSDYTSKTIDLNDVNSYRNFEKDFGPLTKKAVTKYFNIEDGTSIDSIYQRRTELIPDFYTSSFLLKNVKLPPWANRNPPLFILINRLALESDYVTEHLLNWVAQNVNKDIFEFISESNRKLSGIIKSMIPTFSSFNREERLESITGHIPMEKGVKVPQSESVKLVIKSNFLYVIKSGAKIITINVTNTTKEENGFEDVVCEDYASSFIILPDKGCAVYRNPDELTFTVDICENIKCKRVINALFPVTSIGGDDYKCLVTCHSDSTAIIWSNVLMDQKRVISVHNEQVIQAQCSQILNVVVTVDKSGTMIASSYSDCCPYANVKLSAVPLQTLLTNLGLIVSILPIRERGTKVRIEVRDLSCCEVIMKEFNTDFCSACIAHLPNCVEYLILCGNEKVFVIRLYDLSIVNTYDLPTIKDAKRKLIPVSVAFSEIVKAIFIADKTGLVQSIQL